MKIKGVDLSEIITPIVSYGVLLSLLFGLKASNPTPVNTEEILEKFKTETTLLTGYSDPHILTGDTGGIDTDYLLRFQIESCSQSFAHVTTDTVPDSYGYGLETDLMGTSKPVAADVYRLVTTSNNDPLGLVTNEDYGWLYNGPHFVYLGGPLPTIVENPVDGSLGFDSVEQNLTIHQYADNELGTEVFLIYPHIKGVACSKNPDNLSQIAAITYAIAKPGFSTADVISPETGRLEQVPTNYKLLGIGQVGTQFIPHEPVTVDSQP